MLILFIDCSLAWWLYANYSEEDRLATVKECLAKMLIQFVYEQKHEASGKY